MYVPKFSFGSRHIAISFGYHALQTKQLKARTCPSSFSAMPRARTWDGAAMASGPTLHAQELGVDGYNGRGPHFGRFGDGHT